MKAKLKLRQQHLGVSISEGAGISSFLGEATIIGGHNGLTAAAGSPSFDFNFYTPIDATDENRSCHHWILADIKSLISRQHQIEDQHDYDCETLGDEQDLPRGRYLCITTSLNKIPLERGQDPPGERILMNHERVEQDLPEGRYLCITSSGHIYVSTRRLGFNFL